MVVICRPTSARVSRILQAQAGANGLRRHHRWLSVRQVRILARAVMARRIRVVRKDGTLAREIEADELLRILLKPAIDTFDAGDRQLVKKCEACGGAQAVPSKGVIPRICAKCRMMNGQVCCGCGCGALVPISAMRTSKIIRRRGGPWSCLASAARKRHAARTPEQRSETARKVNAARTPEQRSEAARKMNAARTPEQRSETARKRHAARTPEQRSETARKANAARTPEQRSETARKASAARWAIRDE
jgi:hypothetical protein